ncbi:hypothetical protein BDZ97DRAFT_1914508 [Flammula alnicola]|nr:hypothetical protein BDZ97DRAFT_1914508 [Flammula alnicola]
MADEENSTNISVEPHVLCTRCSEFVHNFQRNHILNSDDGKSARFTYRAPGREVQESGLRGCHFCSTISQGLCPAHSDRDLLESRDWFITIGRVQSVSRSSSPKFTADMLLKDPDGKVIKRHSMWIVSNLKITHPPVSSWAWSVSTSSDATFKLAQEWLDQCLANHKICEEVRMKPSSRNGQRFPSYLVDVGSAMPRLCHFKDRPEHPDYLTLSHRWGGSHIFQLTTKNVPPYSPKSP